MGGGEEVGGKATDAEGRAAHACMREQQLAHLRHPWPVPTHRVRLDLGQRHGIVAA